MKLLFTILFFGVLTSSSTAQVSRVWNPDLGKGEYKNPVIHADYSDPDAIRVGNDFYMVASSFDAVPGLPILHSKDLVNWKIIGHALKRQYPLLHFSKTQHGNGVWAPAIRFHRNEFYIYYPDPDFGIYVIKAKDPAGTWSEPRLVQAGKGLIDPCPLWDSNGKAYLVHAFAGSRAGIKSVIVIKQMNVAGDRILDEGKIVYDGHELDPTIEGPKFYKRNGYYYIFAPAGGVATGWQVVLRSKNIYGPYERKVVLDQGNTMINGPHQGAWVSTITGQDWFLHFQDKGAYGRVMHLQPMRWVNNWPVIGLDKDGDGIGQPVLRFQKPKTISRSLTNNPQETDEFDNQGLGLQWQWQANPLANWSFLSTSGYLRLYAVKMPDSAKNYWDVPNLLLQKFPAEQFEVTTKLNFNPNPKLQGEKAGMIILGLSYANIALQTKKDGTFLIYTMCNNADKGTPETEEVITKVNHSAIYLRVNVTAEAICRFSYSFDNKNFVEIAENFKAEPGKWIGAKVGLFCTRREQTNDAGYADFDWFRVR